MSACGWAVVLILGVLGLCLIESALTVINNYLIVRVNDQKLKAQKEGSE